MTSTSQSGGAGQRFRGLWTDPSQTQLGFVQLFGTLLSPIKAHWTHSSALVKRFLALSMNWAICSACSAIGGEVACCCALHKDASNEDLSAWSFPKLVSAACNLVTLQRNACTGSGERRGWG